MQENRAKNSQITQNIVKVAMFIDDYGPWSTPSWYWENFLESFVKKKLPAENDDWDIDSNLGERLMLVIWEGLSEIDFISNNW